MPVVNLSLPCPFRGAFCNAPLHNHVGVAVGIHGDNRSTERELIARFED